MKIVAQNRLWRGSRLADRIQRLRFFRGHGVHSPYVFAIVRNVFMSRAVNPEALDALNSFNALRAKKRVIVELANLATYCHFTTISIDTVHEQQGGLIVATQDCSDSLVQELAKSAELSGTAIVILEPYRRRIICDALLKENRSSSIDRFDYMIFFNNYLPKQHFKL